MDSGWFGVDREMYEEKRVAGALHLLYLPVHLIVVFFIGIVEKEIFGENGPSWNRFIMLLSLIDVGVCFSIFRRVLQKHRNHERVSLISIVLLLAYNAEIFIELLGDVFLKFMKCVFMNPQFYFANVPAMTMVFHALWTVISILTLSSLILAISSRFGYSSR